MMNIQTVKDNLRNTIAGKEAYLAQVRDHQKRTNNMDRESDVIADFLTINIDELKRILADLEKCVEIPERLA